MTDAERKLWSVLRSKQLEGHRFRRQVPMGNYIADFVGLEARLVIEVDGGQHAEAQTYDANRDGCFKKEGFTVLRFWNNEVIENTEGVAQVIVEAAAHPHPVLPLSRGKGRSDGRL